MGRGQGGESVCTFSPPPSGSTLSMHLHKGRQHQPPSRPRSQMYYLSPGSPPCHRRRSGSIPPSLLTQCGARHPDPRGGSAQIPMGAEGRGSPLFNSLLLHGRGLPEKVRPLGVPQDFAHLGATGDHSAQEGHVCDMWCSVGRTDSCSRARAPKSGGMGGMEPLQRPRSLRDP